ncbi:TetR/AcrR family transcriptional regulator [Aeromicrobium chenweiae]|nr:TetR/AcrR family transcriptional regulator [Aeromicrobium chenweiae]
MSAGFRSENPGSRSTSSYVRPRDANLSGIPVCSMSPSYLGVDGAPPPGDPPHEDQGRFRGFGSRVGCLLMERKPGRPRALTVEVIAHAALDDGVDTFSMPSVARRLGVAHSGLYRYVADRDDLLVRAMDIAFDSTTWPDAELPWDELLREIGESTWRACDAHPGLDRATQTAPRPAPSVLARMPQWVARVEEEGFDAADAAVAVEFVLALALDCSSQMGRLRRIRERYPVKADIPVAKPYDTDEVWEGRGLYDRKLAIFLAGLETRRKIS